MRHRINDLSQNDDRPPTNDHQVNRSNPHASHLRMDFHDEFDRSDFASLNADRIDNDSKWKRANQSSQATSQNDYGDLNDTWGDLDFEADLRSRSANDEGIVDDQIFRKYKRILHRYNREYGLSTSTDSASDRESRRGPSEYAVRNHPSFASSAAFSPKPTNYARGSRVRVRTGLRHYNEQHSYYRHFRWIKWLVVAVIVLVIGSVGGYYHYVHNQNYMVASYPKSRSINHVHHHAHNSAKFNSVNNRSVSETQRSQIILLVDELYGRVNRLISNSNSNRVTQLKFSSVPLSRLFINGADNRDFQTLTDRCALLKSRNRGHRTKIKGISPVIRSINYRGRSIQVDLNSRVQLWVNHKERRIRTYNVKKIRFRLVKHNGRYQIIESNSRGLA